MSGWQPHDRPAEKIGEIGLAAKSVIAVGSGKGGVGKSTIAATSPMADRSRLQSRTDGRRRLWSQHSAPARVNQRARHRRRKDPADRGRRDEGDVDGLFVAAGEAVVWRGPMLHGAIRQFLRDTAWGDLDYLIIDMPPGTGDIALTLSQLLPLRGPSWSARRRTWPCWTPSRPSPCSAR